MRVFEHYAVASVWRANPAHFGLSALDVAKYTLHYLRDIQHLVHHSFTYTCWLWGCV